MNRVERETTKVFVLFLLISLLSPQAEGWHDETHLAIVRAAGYAKWCYAVGADMVKIKAGPIEEYNHYFNNAKNIPVTSDMVLSQINRYNDPADPEGHLYGAIIASLREYKKTEQAGKYPEYHLAFCAHYVGDLSQPFHNIPYDGFNQAHHETNDGIVDHEVRNHIDLIEKQMYPIPLKTDHFEEDLAQEIARIADVSRKLGERLQEENRDMTREEAYVQLGRSASLLKAILKSLGKTD
ncbi:MAG: hypothetical protein ACM34I_01880 [bacterium]